jgi:hypothetical protein
MSDIKSEKNQVKKLATERNPNIEAAIKGLFSFETKDQAIERLNSIEGNFIVSAKLPKDDDNSIKLWIRGYQIDKEEEKKGFLGNFAKLSIAETKEGKFTIKGEKQKIALKYHPQRKRPKRKHPDWGHPCLRLVKKEHVFETIEEAQNLLNQIHEDHPEVTIPSVNKLFVIIYSKATKPPVTKYVFEIKAAKEGGYFIAYTENNYQKKKLPTNKTSDKKEDNSSSPVVKGEQEPLGKGYFSSMVTLNRSKKDQIAELKKKSKAKNPLISDSDKSDD